MTDVIAVTPPAILRSFSVPDAAVCCTQYVDVHINFNLRLQAKLMVSILSEVHCNA